MVTGGGNTAIDAARTAIRLGASTRDDSLPPIKNRICRQTVLKFEEALAEGITLVEHAAPTAIRVVNGALEITAITMQPGEPDQVRPEKTGPCCRLGVHHYCRHHHFSHRTAD